jgi:nucleoside-diphosphate-sugar epimerase
MTTTQYLEGKNILITGGAGFIGSYIVEKLWNKSKITIYDNLSRNSLQYLDETIKDNIKIINGDILDTKSLCNAMKDIDVVFHLAAIAGVENVVNKPMETMEVNLIGTYNVIKCAIESKVKKIIFSSTSEVYGPHVYLAKEFDKTTQGPPLDPRWSYSISKLASEHLLINASRKYGFKVKIARLFNVYGPRQTGEGAIRNFIWNAIKNEPLIIYGNGLQVRAWCYVTDAVDGLMLLANNEEDNLIVVNIGNPNEACTINYLAKKVIEIVGSRSEIKRVPSRITDVDLRIPDISLAETLLGYKPKVSLEEGIKRTAYFLRSSTCDQMQKVK